MKNNTLKLIFMIVLNSFIKMIVYMIYYCKSMREIMLHPLKFKRIRWYISKGDSSTQVSEKVAWLIYLNRSPEVRIRIPDDHFLHGKDLPVNLPLIVIYHHTFKRKQIWLSSFVENINWNCASTSCLAIKFCIIELFFLNEFFLKKISEWNCSNSFDSSFVFCAQYSSNFCIKLG